MIFSALLLILWALVVYVIYYVKYPIPLASVAADLSLLLILSLVGLALGRRILRKFNFTFFSFLEESLFSLALGLGIIAYVTLFLGLAGLLYSWLFISLFLALIILLTPEMKEIFFAIRERCSGIFTRRFNLSLVILSFLILGVFSVSLLTTLSPPRFYDTLNYHLALPSLYIQHHRILPVPHNFYSNFPFTGEMLYVIALLLKSDILAKLFHFLCGILIALAIYSFSRKYFNFRVALLAMAIFYTTPYVSYISTRTLVDLHLAFFMFLAFYGLINYFSTKEKRWLILCGMNCGLALGTKYTAWLLSFFLLIVAIIVKGIFENREKFLTLLKRVALFIFIALAVASPWYIKNILYTGNPFYPFLYKIFGGTHWSTYNAQRMMAHLRGHGTGYNLLGYLKTPWSVTMEGARFGTGLLGPLYLIFLPLSFLLFKKGKRIYRYLFLYCAGYFILWVFSQQYTRSLLPLLPLLSIIIAYLIFYFTGERRRLLSWIIIPMVVIAFSFNLFEVLVPVGYIEPLRVVIGLESRDAYLSRKLSYYATVHYLNEHLPPEAKVLFVGESRGYYCQREFIANAVFDNTVIVDLIHSSVSIPGLLERLKEEGITHILYNEGEGERLNRPPFYYFNWDNPEEARLFIDFLNNHTRLLCVKNEVYLYEIDYGS